MTNTNNYCLFLILALVAFMLAGESAADAEDTRQYRVSAGDILGVYIESVLGDRAAGIPIYVPEEPDEPPRIGFPLRVRGDGKLSVPLTDPVDVQGKTLTEIESSLRDRFIHLGASKAIAVTLIRRRAPDEPATYVARPGDVLGIFIAGILPNDREERPPVYLSGGPRTLPSLGFPFPINDAGDIKLPFVSPLRVAGYQVAEIEEAIRVAYTRDVEIIIPGKEEIIVAPMWIAADSRRPSDKHRLQPGDSVAFVADEGPISRDYFTNDLIHMPQGHGPRPFWGVPFPVLEDGTLDLPLIAPVPVSGMNLTEAAKAIFESYARGWMILPPSDINMSLTRIEERTQRKAISRNDLISANDLLCIAGLPTRQGKPRFYFPNDPCLAPAFGKPIPVLPDGSIILPIIGRVRAAGTTASTLGDAIASAYAELEAFQEGIDYVIVRVVRRRGAYSP